MKRDIDLIREILLQVEATPSNNMWKAKPLLGCDVTDVVAHVRLAQDAGLLEAIFTKTGTHAVVQRMLNDGYDFLEQSKLPSRWEKAKSKIVTESLPMTVDIFKSVLVKLVQEQLSHWK